MQSETIQRIDKLTNWLLAVIVIIPFVLSATALNDLAVANGQRPAFLYPIMVDGGLIIFKLLVLRAALRGQRDLYAWTLAVTATAISVALNVHHADVNLTARIMAALPPLAILAAFIAVTRRVEETAVEEGVSAGVSDLRAEYDKLTAGLEAKKQAFDRAVADMRTAYDQEKERLEAEASKLTGQINDLKQEKVAVQADVREARKTAVFPASVTGHAAKEMADGLTERQQQILALMHQDMSQADIAAKLDVSERTVRRDISTMNGVVKELL